MATLAQKIRAEQRMRTLLEENGMAAPDEVEYGHGCIRLLWHEQKACVIVDIDEVPPGGYFGESWLGEYPDDDEEGEFASMN